MQTSHDNQTTLKHSMHHSKPHPHMPFVFSMTSSSFQVQRSMLRKRGGDLASRTNAFHAYSTSCGKREYNYAEQALCGYHNIIVNTLLVGLSNTLSSPNKMLYSTHIVCGSAITHSCDKQQ